MTTSTKEAAARAARATLAGALAVGMVPAAALAAEAPEEAGDGIEALTADVVTEFANAKISQVKLGGAAQATPTGKIEVALADAADGLPVPTQLTSAKTGQTLSLLDKDGKFDETNFEIVYESTSGATITDNKPTAVGTYTVQVQGVTGKDYAGLASAKLSFSIVGKSLEGATLYEVNSDKLSDISDTTFTYNGLKQQIGVALDGAPLKDGGGNALYTIKYYKADGVTLVDNDGPDTKGTDQNLPVDAGSYVAVVTGTGDYEGSEAQIKFTVGKLDLSTADVVANDVATASGSAPYATSLASVNGSTDVAAAVSSLLNFDYPKTPTGTGSYEVTISPLKDAEANITGAKTLSYNVVASAGIYVTYGANTLDSNGKVSALAPQLANRSVDLSQGGSFSTGAITVYPGTAAPTVDGNGVISTTALTSGQYTITVTDQKGNAVDASKLSTPGKWTVTVAVDSAAMDYKLGGKAVATVTVTNGTIAAADIFVTYKGVAKSSFTKTYTGADYLKDVAVKVVVGDKTLAEGTDYEVTCTNSKGEEVKEFTAADTYKVTVTSDTWDISAAAGTNANTCTFTVEDIDIDPSKLTVADQVKITKADGTVATGLPYTGGEITPAFQYATLDEDGKPVEKGGKAVLADLPASAYKITSILDGKGKEVEAVKEAGTYKVTIADADENDSFDITGGDVTVTVIDDKVFQDVPAGAWYAQVVDKAAELGYMKGYAGTSLFGPNDKITRAQVACVLFNMAGGSAGGYDDNQTTTNIGYTSFSDVDSHAYYAQAVAWAKDASVVNGFGDGTFHPEENVTREQFACMLWNYAQATLSPTVKDVDTAAALASKPDGAKVSGWAKDGVAWAVQNKVMGNGGVIDPLGKVTRAEAAAMAVNFQPEAVASKPSTPEATDVVTLGEKEVELAVKGTKNVEVTLNGVVVTDFAGWKAGSSDSAKATAKLSENGLTITGVAADGATVTVTSPSGATAAVTVKVTA